MDEKKLTYCVIWVKLIATEICIAFVFDRCFMRNSEKDAKEMGERRERILNEGFRLFAEKTIDPVPMIDVANAAGVGIATLYRYYKVKSDLVLEISTHVWTKYTEANYRQLQELRKQDLTSLQEYEYTLDSFLDLYSNHKDILRFNQFFNVYVQNEDIPQEKMQPYYNMVNMLRDHFHEIYQKGLEDKTLRTDFSEQTMFSVTMHIMLTAVTRYAVGLVYVLDDSAPESELQMLKQMLLEKFTVRDVRI